MGDEERRSVTAGARLTPVKRKLPKVDGFASKQIAHSSFFKRSQDRRAEQELKRHAQLRDANLIRMYNLQDAAEPLQLELDDEQLSEEHRSDSEQPFRGYEFYENEFDDELREESVAAGSEQHSHTHSRSPHLHTQSQNGETQCAAEPNAVCKQLQTPKEAGTPNKADVHHLRHKYPSKKNKSATVQQLTKEQWQVIKRYYDHHVFSILRSMSLFIQVASLIVGAVALLSSCWIFKNDMDRENIMSSERSLWQEVTKLRRDDVNGSFTHFEFGGMRKTDITIVVLHSFAILTAAISVILTIRGFCARKLPRRLYNFHSAAELLFVGSLASGVSMLTCFVAMTLDEHTAFGVSVHIGYGFVFGLTLPFLLMIGAFFMMFDDLLQLIMLPKLCLIDCLCCCCSSCIEKRLQRTET